MRLTCLLPVLCACAAADTIHPSLPSAVAPQTAPTVLPSLFPVTGGAGVTWIVLERPSREWLTAHDVPHWKTWTNLTPNSYVEVHTLPAPALTQPRTFTLVGAGRPCVITTADTAYLRVSSSIVGIVRVIEVPPATCEVSAVIAIEGVHHDARARRRDGGTQRWSAEAERWAEQVTDVALDRRPIMEGEAAFLERIPDTDVDAIFAFLAIPTETRSSTVVLLLRQGGELLARIDDANADLAGQLSWKGRDYVVVHDHVRAWAIETGPRSRQAGTPRLGHALAP
jgi:hypothetical protein